MIDIQAAKKNTVGERRIGNVLSYSYAPEAMERGSKAVSVDIELYQATRHSVASMAASSGVSIAIIKEVLGHTDIRTTKKYSHMNELSQSKVFAAQDKTRRITIGVKCK